MLLKIYNQPDEAQIGPRLNDLLSAAAAGEVTSVTIVAAFAKRAGIARLQPALHAAKAAGAIIRAAIGIDHRVTTKEGMSDLFAIADELYVVHSTRPDVTFHSKAYLFAGPARAALIIGSSNLTCGGLFTNVEACAEIAFDLPADAAALDDSTSWIDSLLDDSQPHIVRVEAANLSALVAMLPSEAAANVAGAAAGSAGKPGGAAQFFGAGNFPKAPPIAPAGHAPTAPAASPPAPFMPAPAFPANGMWKLLSKWDTSPKSAPGSMIIPLALVPAFPAVGARKKMPTGSFQAECGFPIRYYDGDSQKSATPRFVRYEPAPNHPRPNIEHRLAFHDRSINPNGLAKDDILIFERLVGDSEGAVFNVYRIRPGHSQYAQLRSGKRKFGALA
jgi:HKD family nuclease